MLSFSTSTVAQKLSVHKNLVFLKSFFTKPSFDSFTGVVKSMLAHHSNGTLAQMSGDVGKCISSLGYFFNDAKWNVNTVRHAMQKHLLSDRATRIESGDIAAIDGSSISKKGDTFEFIGETYDNAEKKVKVGYTLLAVSIVNISKKTRWLFDFILYSNKHPKFKGEPFLVHRILRRLFMIAKDIKMVVFDSGFQNKYTMRLVLDYGKSFIIRVKEDMRIWDYDENEQKTKKYHFEDIKKMPNAKHYTNLKVGNKQGFEVTWVRGIINAWMSEINIPITLIRIKNPSFRKPMYVVTTEDPQNLLEAFKVYQTYLQRWKIEQIFQSIKEMGLEKFRLRKMKAIIKYIMIIFILHNMLIKQVHWIRVQVEVAKYIRYILIKKRKIKGICIGGIKIFHEMYRQNVFKLKDVFAVDLAKV